MKIISWNVNGIRAAEKHNFISTFKKIGANIFCLQEIKAQKEQFSDQITKLSNNIIINSAQKPGYSGTAVFSDIKPQKITTTIKNDNFNNEERIIRLDFDNFILINLYLPHGGRKKEKLPYKLEVYRDLIQALRKIKDQNVILVGDFNIAHTEIDLERPQNNKNNIMFTAEEREIINEVISLGFIDTFRHFNKEKGHYTWWPYFADARNRNLGWRIDYCFVSKKLLPKLKSAIILPEYLGSDHCPVGIEIDL